MIFFARLTDIAVKVHILSRARERHGDAAADAAAASTCVAVLRSRDEGGTSAVASIEATDWVVLTIVRL